MESCKLEITLHSGKGLRDVKNFGTMDPYAVVWIAGDGNESKRKTDIAKKGASDPVWDCRMEFDIVSMQQNNYILFFEIKHDGKLFDRKIGEVKVPLADLLAGDASGDKISYPMKIPSGEVMGEIILSHKFSELVERSDMEDGTGTNTSTGTGKVDGGPRKEFQQKKKDGMPKRIAKKVVENLASEIATTVGITALATTFGSNDNQ